MFATGTVDQAFRRPSNHVNVELDQQVAFAHPLPIRDPNLKPFSIQAHRFNSNMDRNLDTFISDKSQGGPLPLKLSCCTATKPEIERIDGQSVASHPLSENRISYVVKWNNGSGQGGIEIHEAYSSVYQL